MVDWLKNFLANGPIIWVFFSCFLARQLVLTLLTYWDVLRVG